MRFGCTFISRESRRSKAPSSSRPSSAGGRSTVRSQLRPRMSRSSLILNYRAEYWRKKTAEMSVVDPFAKARQALVEKSILSSGVTDQRVLKAFLTVPRHEFVFPEYTEQAYADGPLPIGEGQVITQPSLAAPITQALHLHGNEPVSGLVT